MHLNDDDIANVERLIQMKTLQVLEKNLNESVLNEHNEHDAEILCDDEILKEYFGDVYYNDPHNFEFLPGDRKFINLLVQHVQTTVEAKGKNKGLANYALKLANKSRKPKKLSDENVKLSDANADNECGGDSKRLAELKSSLFMKVMDYMRTYNMNEIVDLENVPENIVSVSIQNKKVTGHVYCIICQNDPEKKKSKSKKNFI